MEFIAHRINTVKELKKIPVSCGVELDLRDRGKRCKRRAHDNGAIGSFINTGFDGLDQIHRFFGGGKHFPIADDTGTLHIKLAAFCSQLSAENGWD